MSIMIDFDTCVHILDYFLHKHTMVLFYLINFRRILLTGTITCTGNERYGSPRLICNISETHLIDKEVRFDISRLGVLEFFASK